MVPDIRDPQCSQPAVNWLFGRRSIDEQQWKFWRTTKEEGRGHLDGANVWWEGREAADRYEPVGHSILFRPGAIGNWPGVWEKKVFSSKGPRPDRPANLISRGDVLRG
ncbi:hypothetical protein KM043_016258 [Ampulex compressa]|nr:hypothetical protein KM043_016258 [Ampulex compressa]